MKSRWIRILALALLLALTVSEVSAMAETKKVKIVSETVYAGCGEYWLDVENWTGYEKTTLVKSSNSSVLKVKNKRWLCVIPKKAGKAKITLEYELDGKSYSTSTTFTVKKYPNPIKSLKINGKSIKLKDSDRLGYTFYLPDDGLKSSIIINMKPASGWSISKIRAYSYSPVDDDVKEAKFTVKNNKKFTLKAELNAKVTYTLKHKKGQTFNYGIHFWRLGDD